MTYNRLLYLSIKYDDIIKYNTQFQNIVVYMRKNPEILLQTVLERSEEFIDLVIAFLSTLPKE